MLREMDFVEGDCAALCWAIGSAAAILKSVDAPITDPADLPRRMLGFEKKVRRWRFRASAVGLAECMAVAPFIFFFPNQLQGIGALFIVSGGVFGVLIQLLLTYLHCPGMACTSRETAPLPCVAALRASLTLRRDLDVGAGRLLYTVGLYIPGWMLFCAGFLTSHYGSTRPINFAACTLIFPILNLLLSLELARKYRHRIDELDVLQKGGRHKEVAPR
jgi:hypothetical protein